MVVKRKTKSSSKKAKTTKSKTKSTKATKASKAKLKSKAKPKRKAFGGYAINFAGRKETVEQVFGKKPIAPSEMTKKIWAFIKSKGISNK